MARPKEYDADLRARLVAGAAEAVAAGGVDAISLRALADSAKTSTNAIYTLFGSRAGLLGALLEEAASSFTAAQRAVPLTADSAEDFRELGRAYRGWALQHRSLYAVMFGARSGALWRARNGVDQSDQCPPTTAQPESAMGPLLDHIRHGQSQGILRAAEPMVIATVIWAAVHGFVSLEIAQWADNPRAERDALYEECLSASHAYWTSAVV